MIIVRCLGTLLSPIQPNDSNLRSNREQVNNCQCRQYWTEQTDNCNSNMNPYSYNLYFDIKHIYDA